MHKPIVRIFYLFTTIALTRNPSQYFAESGIMEHKHTCI